MNDFETRVKDYISIIDNALDEYFPQNDCKENEIISAVRYSLLANSKRIRPILLMEFCRICGGNIITVIPFACAIEMIHTYSLIHDDLPCMDNDDFRRGKPTNHKAFGEAMALLSGDALLTRAFEIMLNEINLNTIDPDIIIKTAGFISSCSGIGGMIGGQVLDLKYENEKIDINTLYDMHLKKTGALIKASCAAGCMLAGSSKNEYLAAVSYATQLGLAFQIIDDILDVVGNSEKLGKNTGADSSKNKSTFVSVLGLEKAKKEAEYFTASAKNYLTSFKNNDFLLYFTDMLLKRDN